MENELKPYDVKVLLVKLKGRGLDVAEDAAKLVVEEVLNWVGESAQASPNKYDDLVSVLIPMIKPHILEAVDKIDGQPG